MRLSFAPGGPARNRPPEEPLPEAPQQRFQEGLCHRQNLTVVSRVYCRGWMIRNAAGEPS
jgi:hypothetical protein